jgi:rubrerythrin
LLQGKGFKEVYNLSGGIKAWQGLTTAGPEDMGMELLKGDESPAEVIRLAYGMEMGLGEFYTIIAASTDDSEMAAMLSKLAGVEEKHKLRLLDLYLTIDRSSVDQKTFEKDIDASVMEGGFTTEEFLEKNKSFLQTVTDILSIAMMLETQAMDLYMRYADKSTEAKTKEIFYGLAEEEKMHLKHLGDLLNHKA